MSRMKNRWTAVLLLVCLVLSLVSMCSPALAESYTVYVASNTLKVFQKATSSSKLLGPMGYGEKMTCTAVKDDWAQVKNSDGAVGYCKRSGLTTDNPNTLDEEVFLNKSGVKVYKRPSTSADVMATVTDNFATTYTAVAVTGDGDWIRLKNGKHYGYAQAKYVSPVADLKPEASDKEEEKEETDFGKLAVWIGSDTLKVYKAASASSKTLGTMSFGEELILLGIEGEWAEVENAAGTTGYCLAEGLLDKDPNVKPVQAHATENKVKIYAKPTSGAKEIARLSEGDTVDVVAVNGDKSWLRVIYNGSYGYVQSKYLSLDDIPAIEPDDGDAEGVTAYIGDLTAAVYEKADDSSGKLGLLAYGESVELLNVDDGWAKIRNAAGAIGYCRFGALVEENPNDLDIAVYAARDGVEIYARPLEDAAVAAKLQKDAQMKLVAAITGTSWCRVQLDNGSFGYMNVNDMATQPGSGSDAPDEEPEEDGNPSDELAASATAQAIIALAKEQLGDPYVYAASGPDKFDCSGLVYYCFKEITGIRLTRTAYAQGYDDSYAKIENAADLLPGDLVFFNTNSDDSDLSDHSGIYIGSGKFIHASSAAAKVITSDLSSGYYQRNFSWGRRVL